MRRQFIVAFGLVGAFVATTAHALGLGTIRIDSGLNQPFAAQIPLLSVRADQLETVRVRLADPEEFRRLGIERADFLSDLRFELVAGASPVIRISSGRPARDPFLTFLLDVRTDNQRVLREYTVLLDPPAEAVSRGTVTAQTPVAGPTQEPFPPPRSEPQPTPRPTQTFSETPPAAPIATPRPAVVLSTTSEPDPTPAPRQVEPPSRADADADAGSRYGPIQPQETLWSIANAVRPESASVNQTLLALYTANPSAFDRGRFDGLLRGVTLTVPPASVITQVDPVTARDRVLALQAGRAPAASPQESVRPTPRPTLRPTPVATPLPTPTPTPTPTPSPTPVAALAPPSSADDPLAASTEADPAFDRSDRDAFDGGMEGADQRLGLDGETLSGDDAFFEEDEVFEEVGGAAELDERPAAIPAPAAPVNESGGLLDALLLPLLLVLIAALVVAGWWWSRRRRAKDPAAISAPVQRSTPSSKASATTAAPAAATATSPSAADLADEAEAAVMAAFAGGRNEAAVPPADEELESQPDFLEGTAEPEIDADPAQDLESTQIFSAPLTGDRKSFPDTADFSSTGQFQVDAVKMDLGDQDPAAEADIHMAYGLYDEAELSLNKALEASPDRPDWLFKLAEVHFAAGRGLQFVETAERSKPHLSAADWQKLALLGRQIAPENPLFADADDAAAMAADVDLSFDEPVAAESGQAPASTDKGADLPELSLDTPVLDVDTAIDPNSLEFNLDDFQVDEVAASEAEASASKSPAEDSGSEAASDRGGSVDFDLELSPVMPSSAAVPETEPAPEVDSANRLEFSLDDFDAPATAEASSTDEPPAADARGDAIDFELDSFDQDDSDTISSGDEAATKLDLARAYVDMGDKEMAEALLSEVLSDGNAQQQDEARALIARMA